MIQSSPYFLSRAERNSLLAMQRRERDKERLWLFMNKKVHNNKYFEKFQEFKKATLAFFKNISDYKDELERFLVRKFHIIET